MTGIGMERRQFIAGTATAITVTLAGCESRASGPEDVAKAYLNAWINGNVEKQNKLSHDDGTVPPDNEYELDLTVQEVSTESVEAVADARDTDADRIEASANDTADNINADDWTYVFCHLIPMEGEDTKRYMLLVKDDDWFVHTLSFP